MLYIYVYSNACKLNLSNLPGKRGKKCFEINMPTSAIELNLEPFLDWLWVGTPGRFGLRTYRSANLSKLAETWGLGLLIHEDSWLKHQKQNTLLDSLPNEPSESPHTYWP